MHLVLLRENVDSDFSMTPPEAPVVVLACQIALASFSSFRVSG